MDTSISECCFFFNAYLETTEVSCFIVSILMSVHMCTSFNPKESENVERVSHLCYTSSLVHWVKQNQCILLQLTIIIYSLKSRFNKALFYTNNLNNVGVELICYLEDMSF